MSRVTILLLIIVVFAACYASHAAYWDVEPVYLGGFASGNASLAVSPANLPHVSYTANEGLYLAARGLEEWEPQYVAQVGFWGGWSSLQFSGAQPCIAFIDGSGLPANYLKYATRPSSDWVFETVDDVGWLADRVSLGFDSSGRACIAYCKTVGEQVFVYFAQRTGPNNWTKQMVAQVGAVTGTALAISGSSIYISFVDSATGQMKVAARTGAGLWQVQTVDGSALAPAASCTSLVCSPDGRPSAAYFIVSSGTAYLKLADRRGGNWHTETVTAMPSGFAHHCSLAITPGGMPLIAYFHTTSETLKHAWKSGETWHTETIDASPGAGARPVLKLDLLGRADVVYIDGFWSNVKFAWAIYPRTLAEVKTLADGATVQLSGVVASTSSSDLGSMLYVLEQNRSMGVRLQFDGAIPPVSRGMLLDVQGQLSTINGERVLIDPDLAQIGLMPGAGPTSGMQK